MQVFCDLYSTKSWYGKVYSGYGMAFDGKDELCFRDGFVRIVEIFGADNSSSSHTNNYKNTFSVLGEGDTFRINVSFGASEERSSVNFSETKTKVCIVIVIIVVCLLMEKKSFSLKPIINMLTF